MGPKPVNGIVGVMLQRFAEMALPMRAFRMVAAALAVTLLVACQQAGTPMTLDGVTLLRYEPNASRGSALYQGTLSFRDGCTWVDDGRGAEALALWPPDARLERVGGSIHVIVGQVSVTDGDAVSMGGKPVIGQDRLRDAEALVGSIPPGCVADMYWMAASVSTSIFP